MIATVNCLNRYIIIRGSKEFVEEISFEKEKPNEMECMDGEVYKAKLQIEEYLNGKRKVFDIRCQFEGTPFQEDVWKALTTIEYGTTKNYQAIAQQVKREKAVRAVGGACHVNPIGIIVPCHRVIGKNASLTGYAGGVDFKEFLLELERKNV